MMIIPVHDRNPRVCVMKVLAKGESTESRPEHHHMRRPVPHGLKPWRDAVKMQMKPHANGAVLEAELVP
jgi:hypothetical protein